MSGIDPVGLVGLGAIGGELAGALIDASHRLVVYDTRPEAVAALVERGAVAAASVAELADAAPVVLLSLPTPAVVREVAIGEGGLVGGRAVRLVVDLSTTGAIVAEEVAGALEAAGIAHLDAPVSGGVAGAKARSLTVMTSGDPAVLARVQPLLETFGRRVFHVGSRPGQGQTAKLLNNLLSATAMAITAEAMTAGVRCGLDPATLLEVINASSGRNSATQDKFPEDVITRRFAAGFRLALMTKDVELALSEARAKRLPMFVGGLVQQIWSLAAAQSDDDADFTEIARLYEDWAGVEIAASAGTTDAGG